MSHDDFDFEPSPGLPAPLPQGERLLWQGTPEWKSLAIHVYHVRKVAIYFLVLVGWRVAVGLVNSHALHDIYVSCALLVTMGGVAMAVLCALAYFAGRATVYTITSRRILMRHGIAVPLTMNVPLRFIDGVALKVYPDGGGDIALATPKDQRIGYLITWPHLRPGHFTRPQPSFRALRDPAAAAEILSKALAADGETAAAAAELAAGIRTPEPRACEPRSVGQPSTGSRSLGTSTAAA